MMTIAHTTAPASEPTTYSIDRDPINDLRVWELTDRERAIYELGFLVGYGARQGLSVDLKFGGSWGVIRSILR